jgi:hypothetical protein
MADMASKDRPERGVDADGFICVQCGEPAVAPMSSVWICDYTNCAETDLPDDPAQEVRFCRPHYDAAFQLVVQQGHWLAARSPEKRALVHRPVWDEDVAFSVRREEPGSRRDSALRVEKAGADLSGASRSEYRIVGLSVLVDRLPTLGEHLAGEPD